MSNDPDKASNDEILNLLREIRDGQRELILIAEQDRALDAKQREEWDKWQSQLMADQPQDAPDWKA